MGAVEAESKAVSPWMTMNFLGICFDTELLRMEVLQGHRKECQIAWACWLNGLIRVRSWERRLRVWLGSPASLPCVWNWSGCSYNACCIAGEGCQRQERWTSRAVRKDLLEWRTFLPHYNGVSMMLMERWSLPDKVVVTDACLSGRGAWIDTQEWVLSCRIPWGNQDAGSEYQRIGATNSGGSSKGLREEVARNANCDQVW